VGLMFLDVKTAESARVDEFVTEVADACNEFGGYDPKRGYVKAMYRCHGQVLGWIYQAWADDLLIKALGMYKKDQLFSPAELAFLELLPRPPLSFRHRRIVRGLFDRARAAA
jgi:hypothetical protein